MILNKKNRTQNVIEVRPKMGLQIVETAVLTYTVFGDLFDLLWKQIFLFYVVNSYHEQQPKM